MNFYVRKLKTSGKGGSAIIRGVQMAKYLGGELNPEEHDGTTCVYVKIQPPEDFPKNSYLDVVDGKDRIEWLLKHPEIGVIACSESGKKWLAEKLNRNDIILIPQHHCNYERFRRNRKEIKVAGTIGRTGTLGRKGSHFIKDEYKKINRLAEEGISYIRKNNYSSREDIVNFYKKIDVQIIGKRHRCSLKNSLKIVNACSFGIPTIAYPEAGYEDMEGYYYPARTANEIIEVINELKKGWDVERLIKKSEEYHIEKIARLYKNL